MKKLLLLIPFMLMAKCDVVKVVTEDFDSVRVGEVPFGWVASQTNKKSPAIWEVDKHKRLVILRPRGYRSKERNIFFTKDYYFRDGSVAADVMPGPDGGVIFRARDRKDYYDVRIQQGQLIVEKVQDGKIEELGRFKIAKKDRYRLKVSYCGDKATIYLDGKEVGRIDIEPMEGGVGVCASGQSKAVFDNIRIEVAR
ncbi:MAG: hypothetical protein C6H99_03975 [Epsilonproteobacteria bacterium]|nr:hypothetical protein [Campylobacterota bacterium]NPA64318.1 hypothetical protein [Campylobacterota bacterium]